MDIFAFIAQLIGILAWPAVVVTLVLVFSHESRKRRREIEAGNARALALKKSVERLADEREKN
jgi:hypothetical protein